MLQQQCGNKAQAVLDKYPDGFAIFFKRPGEGKESGPASQDAGSNEDKKTCMNNAGKNCHDLDRRKMGKARGDKKQGNGVFIGAGAQRFEGDKLAVKIPKWVALWLDKRSSPENIRQCRQGWTRGLR